MQLLPTDRMKRDTNAEMFRRNGIEHSRLRQISNPALRRYAMEQYAQVEQYLRSLRRSMFAAIAIPLIPFTFVFLLGMVDHRMVPYAFLLDMLVIVMELIMIGSFVAQPSALQLIPHDERCLAAMRRLMLERAFRAGSPDTGLRPLSIPLLPVASRAAPGSCIMLLEEFRAACLSDPQVFERIHSRNASCLVSSGNEAVVMTRLAVLQLMSDLLSEWEAGPRPGGAVNAG